MKTYKEMADSVLTRSEEIIKEKKKRNKKIIGITASALCCAVILAGAGAANRNIYDDADGADYPKSESREPSGAIVYEKPDQTHDAAIIAIWKGKSISASLNGALKEYAEDKNAVYALTVQYIGSAEDREFVYKGKTIGEYADILGKEEEKNRNNETLRKLEMLLKDGNYLKYGEDIYKIGAPDGTKWSKAEYDASAEYYGEEFLGEYIKGGVFYSDKVGAAAAEYKAYEEKCRNDYEEACNAYRTAARSEATKSGMR